MGSLGSVGPGPRIPVGLPPMGACPVYVMRSVTCLARVHNVDLGSQGKMHIDRQGKYKKKCTHGNQLTIDTKLLQFCFTTICFYKGVTNSAKCIEFFCAGVGPCI